MYRLICKLVAGYAECVVMHLIYASFRVSFSETSLNLDLLCDTDLYSVVRWHTSRFNIIMVMVHKQCYILKSHEFCKKLGLTVAIMDEYGQFKDVLVHIGLAIFL